MKLFEIIADIYYVGIKGYHKHDYKRIEDGVSAGVSWPRHQCSDPDCGKISGLDGWQIKSLPWSMLYEKVQSDGQQEGLQAAE